MKKILILFVSIFSFTFSSDYIPNEVDCLVIKEENSIICKYISNRTSDDRFINVEWISPDKEISRTRKILFPSGHGSVYDFRYLSGREIGEWSFKVTDGDEVFSTKFEVTE